MEVSTFIRTSVAAVIGLSLASTAAAQTLLNSFEDTPFIRGDGKTEFSGTSLVPAIFSDASGGSVSNVLQVSGTGVTEGASAASVVPLNAFSIAFQLDLTPAIAAQLADGGAFAVDVYGTVAPGDDGFGIQFASLTEAGGFGDFTVLSDAGGGGNFFFVSPETQSTVTLNLDATAINTFNNVGQVGILFVIVNNDTPSTVIFDNARIVPEPATAALLGFAALAGLRRRR